MENKHQKKNRYNKQRQAFLMTFFDSVEGNEHKEVNGFILEKMWNGNTKNWQVAIYTKEMWARREQYA